MILIAKEVGSRELAPLVRQYGVQVEIAALPFGDFAFEGNGPKGSITIGVERKTLHDMLSCIDDSRYSAHQKPGMEQLYDAKYLVIEGCWRPHDESGMLMEGFRGGASWGYCRPGGRGIMYAKLRRYLFSVGLSGVQVIYTRDIRHTAYDLCELYRYFQKAWTEHTALLSKQQLLIPSLTGKPSLIKRWAAELGGIGTKLSEEAERRFGAAGRMANADEVEWLNIPGVGIKTAKSIVKEIWK